MKQLALNFVLNNKEAFTDDEIRLIREHYDDEYIFRLRKNKLK